MYTMYANASNNHPSYTHVSPYVIWRVQTPWVFVCVTQILEFFKYIAYMSKWLFGFLSQDSIKIKFFCFLKDCPKLQMFKVECHLMRAYAWFTWGNLKRI